MHVAGPVRGSCYSRKCNGYLRFDCRSGFYVYLLLVEHNRWRMAIWLVIARKRKARATIRQFER
jgi:hypothetical protein